MEKRCAMNILVLENDPKELAVIQQALSGQSNQITPVGSSAQVLQALQGGNVRFVIADSDNTDLLQSQLIPRIRELQTAEPVYVLVVTSKDGVVTGMDDVLHRPYIAADLKNRIDIAERIMVLTSRLAKARAQMESQAAFDSLTGFMNRTGFLRQAAGELERSRRASHSMSVVALDIDNFTIINDRFGKKIGDDVLQVAAESIRDKSRPYDCIGRWAGDEFVLALPGVIGADAEKVALRIMAGIVDTRIEVPNEEPLNVQASAGIASLMRITANTEIEPLILSAREALARAKQQGGNQVYTNYL